MGALHSLVIFAMLSLGMAVHDYNIYIDDHSAFSALHHFWKSTGMCPPLPHQAASHYFLSKDMLWNLINIGAIPHSGITQVRMHWLLDLVTHDYKSNMYNFTDLDSLLHLLNRYGLKPGFELMGNPSGKFTDFDVYDQILDWMNFITLLAKRYIAMFGLETVKEWNFETWNEPDHKDFDKLSMSVEGFLMYYDACSEGLKMADKTLIFGGPGGSCRKRSFSKRCWALFDHCTSGKNYITGEKGSRINYISIHKKGGNSSAHVLESELETIGQIHNGYPKLTETPIFNDEGDPMVGWSTPYAWRGDATYPAIVAKIISQHQHLLIANRTNNVKYDLLSNDNGFLNFYPHFFTQRTLNARFQMNNTSPPHIHLVKKPIYSLMILLSKLGDMQLRSKIMTNQSHDIVGCLASECSAKCESREVSILIYASNDTSPHTTTFSISVTLRNMSLVDDQAEATVMKCTVDNFVTNPVDVWMQGGKQDFPSSSSFEAMHNVSEPACSKPFDIESQRHQVKFDFKLHMPGVVLYQICWKPRLFSTAPHIISVTNVTSAQVLVSWSDKPMKTKCIQTYKIHLCVTLSLDSCNTVNKHRVLSNSFVFIQESGVDKDVHGYYRIVAVDFWDRASPFSNPYHYSI